MARLGNYAEAIRHLVSIVSEPEGALTYPTNRVLALEFLGPLYEQVGETEKAIRAYAQFADAWRDADPELQPRVEAAVARVSALRGPGR